MAARTAPLGFMHSTRERILHHLKRHPGAGVESLAQTLGLAPMTIRQQLAKMAADGLVHATAERRPTGRPAHAYHLTAQGEDRFPKAYDRLANLLLDEVMAVDGQAAWATPAGRADMFRRLARRAAGPHLADLERLDEGERAQATVTILRDESGFAELEHTSSGLEIREYNCVFQRLVEGHADVCLFHTEYIGNLLGRPVELDGCQCDGAIACRFRALG